MALTAAAMSNEAYASHVNPQWARLLNLLEMNVQYESCSGVELRTSAGRTIFDFLSGYCVHNAGHNHPEIVSALKDELDQKLNGTAPVTMERGAVSATRIETCVAAT